MTCSQLFGNQRRVFQFANAYGKVEALLDNIELFV